MLRRQVWPHEPMSFIAGKSEMARMIREYDWSDHPFGAAETWPQSLRSALSICLQSAFPTAIYWGPELRLLYNDAWSPIPGPRHPKALGAPAREVWSDIWHIIEPQFVQLIATGEGISVEDQMLPMRRFGILEETYWNYSFTPIRGEDGGIEGIFNSGSETTRNVLSRRQMRFLLDLGEALRTSADARSARQLAIRMLGEHLGVDRVGFREFEPVSGELAVTDEWTAEGIAPLGSEIRIGELGEAMGKRLANGHVVRIDDISRDPDFADGAAGFASIGVAAAIAIPSIKDNKLDSVMFLHSCEPRMWNDFAVSTAEDVLERTVTWLERERAAERERIIMREVDHRARNVLAVAQSIVRLTDAADIKNFREKIETRLASLSRAHTLLATERWSAVEFGHLLAEELAPYVAADANQVRMDGPPVLLRPEILQSVALVIHELATNAAKYGAFRSNEGRLSVTWQVSDRKILGIEWLETVPSVDENRLDVGQESGFGTSLITRVVEEQFGGTIERTLNESGLRCVLTVPLIDGAGNALHRSASRQSTRSETVEAARKTILIVEDEPLLAMDLENMVVELGYEVFGVYGSLAASLEALSSSVPDAAVLDGNLQGESSLPIANFLQQKDVPVIFATGYEKFHELPENLKAAPFLSKPVSERDLAQAIADVLATA